MLLLASCTAHVVDADLSAHAAHGAGASLLFGAPLKANLEMGAA